MSNKIQCPLCGKELKSKTIKKGGNYKRSFKSFICYDCNYSEYDNNVRESAIENGMYDDEFGILKE